MDSVVASAMISGVAREAREDRLRETYGRGEPSEPTTEGFASALRENLHDDMADSRSFNRETLRPGQIAISFPVESYHVATSIPRVEMIRASRRDAILARVSMDIAGKLNNAMVQHLVKDCKTEELLRYKRSIIEEIKKRNQGERHE